MKLLLTGGAGFIGSHTADCALQMGFEVVIVDRCYSGRAQWIDKRCSVYEADVSSKELRDIFERETPDYCMHLAEQGTGDESLYQRGPSSNLRGLIHVLDLCKEFGVQKLVYGSSADVYGATEPLPVDESSRCFPMSGNGRAKVSSEEYIKQYGALYGLNYSILRYTNVYGVRQTAGSGHGIAELLETIASGSRPQLHGKGQQLRDFVFVTDVAAANMLALTRGTSKIYNIGSGSAIRLMELVETVSELLGYPVIPHFKPARPEDLVHLCVSSLKAEKELGWLPRIRLKEGLTQALSDCIYRRFIEKANSSPKPAQASAAALINPTAS